MALPISLTSNSQGGRLRLINNEYRHNFVLNRGRGAEIELDYSVNVPASIFAVAAEYNLSLEVDLLDFSSKQEIAATQTIELRAEVNPRLQVNIAGTNSANRSTAALSTVDFGALETSETRQIFVQLRGNVPAIIGIRSENNGRLLLQEKGSKGSGGDYINYSVNVDGVSSELKSALSLRRRAALDLRGSSYPMIIKIGDVEGAFAGRYKDVITIEVRPQ